MGSSGFAAMILDRLLAWDGCGVAAVYTRPDRPAGRGRRPASPPVKDLALARGLVLRQPENFKDQAEVRALAELGPDILAVAAYGLILPQAVLDLPRLMPVNVHASLLPKYRGPAPIQRAIQNGDQVTGVTIMRMEAGLDTGPILLQRALRIGDQDHAGTVHDELAEMGGECLVEALQRLAQGRLTEVAQDDSLASYAPKLTRRDGLVDWNLPAGRIHNQVRAVHPRPGAYFFWSPDGKRDMRLAIAPGRVGDEAPKDAGPGTILGERDGLLAIVAADRIYLVPEVRPEGGRTMSAKAFCNGYLKG
ncbi:MAG: methionyl-tRNA formyltransferase [Desulfovibrionaceae bacterium]|nr:methionyl-tRNA formyltransferase [Desulfovibrionaceae bacterium]